MSENVLKAASGERGWHKQRAPVEAVSSLVAHL